MAIIYDPLLGRLRYSFSAGPGIDIKGSVISVITPPEGVPYVAGTGIGINGATITNTLSGFGRIEVAGGTAAFNPEADIVTVTGTSVTLQPDTAYKIYATASAVTLNANPPASGKWAYEGHLEIFVASTGYIVTGANVVLANALEPDSVNNCTVRFHDGIAIISVEDHVAGYIVVNGSTAGDGSLYYGITTSTNEYIAFDATLNGTTIDLSGSTANGEKHIVGNGYNETTLTGSVDCGNSKFTVANLALSDVQVVGGTMTLGDAFIPSGSTVSLSGGGLAVEKVTGAGAESVIDFAGGYTGTSIGIINASDVTFNKARLFANSAGVLNITSCTFANRYENSYNGAAFSITGTGAANISACKISGNTANGRFGGGIYCTGNVDVTSSVVSGNSASFGGGIFLTNGADMTLTGSTVTGNTAGTGADCYVENCTFTVSGGELGNVKMATGGNMALKDKVKVGIVTQRNSASYGTVTLSSGAILDLTGNANATTVAPGGGITFEAGGATVLYDHDSNGSAMASSASYMMDNVTLPAGAKLTNTAVVDLNNTNVVVPPGMTASISGCIVSGGSAATNGGGFYVSSGTLSAGNAVISACRGGDTHNGGCIYATGPNTTEIYLSGTTISGCGNVKSGGAVFCGNNIPVQLVSCVITGNTANAGGALFLTSGTFTASGAVISGNTAPTRGKDLYFGAETASITDCTIGTVTLAAGGTMSIAGGNTIDSVVPYSTSNGGAVVITSGASINLTSSINPGGDITILEGGCTVNGNVIPAGTYTSIDSNGQPTE